MLVVVFSMTDATKFKSKAPKWAKIIVISPVGDFIDLKSAKERMLESEFVMFAHEDMDVNWDVVASMKRKLKTSEVYGAVFSDYLKRINHNILPRLRKSYRKKNKVLPVFGAVFQNSLFPELVEDIINCQNLTVDSFMKKDLNFIPYHIPDFSFVL